MVGYTVPSMKEIEAIPWNGYKVASTFSGGGGSCLGYRMAGYKVLYANEFVEEAQMTYKANHPNSYLDTRDIRTVRAEEIMELANVKKGELDVFDGSPPCCAFSTAGSREKGWGKERAYSDGKKQVIDNLFFEYTRLVRGIQPKVFIAENVSGLVKGSAKGYFKQIISEMKDCGYEVKAQLLNAKFLGVPQARERIIFVGVRKDLGVQPAFPKPRTPVLTVADAFDGMIQDEEQRMWLIEEWAKTTAGKYAAKMPKNPDKTIYWASFSGTGTHFNLLRASFFKPANTILQTCSIGACMPMHPTEDRTYTIPELKRLTSLPDDFMLTGTYKQQWERCGRMVPPLMMKAVAQTVKDEILCKIM